MVAQFLGAALQKLLIEGLELIPQSWVLTPLRGNKAPYRTNWQHESPLTRGEIIAEIHSGEAKGYGIRTGTVSGGIVAIDFDGSSAMQKALELAGGESPDTVSFTSNRPGREQRLYLIPQEYWGAVKTTKIKTGVIGDDGKPEQLELRWDGCQSVLPPSIHPMTGSYRWRKSPQEVVIAPAPMWVIEQMLVTSGETETPLLSPHPQEDRWTDKDWALSYLNALSSYRADDYDEWLAVGMALHSVDDSLLSDWHNWSRQSQKYTPGCCEKKWKSFKSKGVAIGTLARMAKQDGWRSPFDKPTGRGYAGGIGSGGNGSGRRCGSGGSGGGDGGDGGDRTGKVVRFPSFDALSVEQVTEKIDELIAQGVGGSYLTGQLNRLAAVSQYYVGELRKLYYERLGEADKISDRDTNQDEIENLLNLNEQSLDLTDYLPQSLAQPITQWCDWLNIRPAVALTALLAGISSVHKTGTELVLQRNQNFRVPSTVYAGLVSPSGQKKSPIFHNLIRQPLTRLRQEKVDAYQAAMEDYQAALKVWEQSENKGAKPEKPKDATLYYFTNATGEAIPVQASKDPEKPLLALIDELAGYFNSNNAYRSGRGSDKQDLLSYFDGSGQTILRAGGVRVDLPKIYLSIFGTIQPDVLKHHMEDCSDPDGNWARFLFVNQPLQAAILHDDDGMAVQISDRLTEFYRGIDQLPEMEYRLSRQAFKCYQKVYNQLERLRVTHPKSGMAAVYSKMEGYIGRLALNLHVLWELDAGKACPDEEIPLFIMEMAIQLAKFYMGQVKLMHANADDESLPRHITRMMELSKRLETNGLDGWIKAKQIQDLFAKKKRPSAQQIRDWMNEAVALGYGRTRGTGNRLEYHWISDNNTAEGASLPPKNLGNLGKLGEDLGIGVPQTENLTNQGIETNLGNLGKGIPKFDEEVKTLITNPDNPPDVIGDSEENETTQEGGYVPQASPTLPQEPQTVEESSNSDFGNNLGNPSPTLPQVPQACDSSAQACVTVAAPKLAHTSVGITELAVGDRVIWDECPAHCASFNPFEVMAIDAGYVKLDLFEKPVPILQLRKQVAAH